MTPIRSLEIPSGTAVLDVLPTLARALSGDAPVAPYAAGSAPPDLPCDLSAGPRPLPVPMPMPDDLALVVGTSGSTGTPKRALLSAAALRASIAATDERLGGPGAWLLALPGHHIAGLQVLLRSIVADRGLAVLDTSGPFEARAFVKAADALAASAQGERRYVSLVPTQLVRLLGDPVATASLAEFAGVLVGGAALAPQARALAEEAGITVHRTYGMSETAGGCVYNGVPLTGVSIDFDTEGRVLLGGPMVAHGYLDRADPANTAFQPRPVPAPALAPERPDPGSEPAMPHPKVKNAPLEPLEGCDSDLLMQGASAAGASAQRPSGTELRWFRTDDLGHLDPAGRLVITGRADDLINSGGLKIAPHLVEDAILGLLPPGHECVVFGAPDPQWGEAVVAAIAPPPSPALTVAQLREELRGILAPAALPQRLLALDAIPLRGPGKPDRAALRALAD